MQFPNYNILHYYGFFVTINVQYRHTIINYTSLQEVSTVYIKATFCGVQL